MRPLRFKRVIVCTSLAMLVTGRSDAGGPLNVFQPGQAYVWPNRGVNIPFNPDRGGLGPLTNAQAVAQTTAAFAPWQAVPSATATHVNVGQLSVDVDETNFFPFLQPMAPDGLSAIVYDEDGAIFNLLFGPDSGVLGFAGPQWVNTANGTILEGVAFLNGGSLLGMNALPVAEFLSVQVHEFGHYQNLAHTVVNGQLQDPFGTSFDTTGPTPFDTFPRPASFAGLIETMYPFLFVNGGQATLHADDIAIFSHLYPEPTFATSAGTVTGSILAPNGRRETGVNVIARNIADPFNDAVSAISSDFTDDFASGAPFVGVYTLRGLTPGASYAIFVDTILRGGFSTPPKVPLAGPEEFYNGAGESDDFVADVPSVFTPVSAAAGATVTGIDIIFNQQPPTLTLGDDTTLELFPEGFAFSFCGRTYDSLFVNSNGNVSFGTGSTSFLDSAAALLSGPPRIAGLYDDLDPSAGGSIEWSQDHRSVTVTFLNVPEFVLPPVPGEPPPVPGANTFRITLRSDRSDTNDDGDDDDDRRHGRRDGSRFSIDYGALSAQDGTAGYSCGNRITSGFELETNLSALRRRTIEGDRKAAIYEVFTALDNDLDNLHLSFEAPEGFRDALEPNDRLPGASGGGNRRGGDDDDDDDERGVVRLPFDTVDRFTAIDPLGDDVDFYRFRGRAGDIVAIETVPGNVVDTMIGLFNSGGTLLALDDDGGVGGVGSLSRLLVQLTRDDTYTVGVTAWPDFDFTGAGLDFGRYVLSIRSYRGTILPVTEDGAVEVSFTRFLFPFQGVNWSGVFVNGNGNLTFGTADNDPLDFIETVPKFLNGPPRIAPLWDDLSPTNFFTGAPQGLVIAEGSFSSMRIHFVAVPEFLDTGTNYFTVTLDRRGDITFDYGATNRSDGLIGITQGNGAVDPGPTNLLAARRLPVMGRVYETFSGSFGTYGGVDLSFRTVEFKRR